MNNCALTKTLNTGYNCTKDFEIYRKLTLVAKYTKRSAYEKARGCCCFTKPCCFLDIPSISK